ncbi:helix-turn-helix domain-containing protein [Streptomyces sp. NPDC017248]|uniref:helix-turn-helix domain-containing protein n=1 Tax=unclassified Streptomyces TaxID=2593676 RepID=UPI0037B452BD
MRPPSAQPGPPAPPFDAPAARGLRAALGMGPEHVAYGMRAAYGLPYVTAGHVIAWERGTAAPSSRELTALAGVLWCSPGELIGRPRTLREHRVARSAAPEDIAHAVGMDLRAYLRAEESGQWRGTERQSAALARVLDLAPRDFTTATGRAAQLAELLRGAVTTRWQAYVRPVTRLVPLDQDRVERALRELHQDYQGRMAATLGWGGGSRNASESGRRFLAGITTAFWTATEDTTTGRSAE